MQGPAQIDRTLRITEQAFVGILNGPEYDSLPAATKNLLHLQCQFSLGKTPAGYSRFVALNWNFTPGRVIYTLPAELVSPKARKFDPYIQIIERLKPSEIDMILQKEQVIRAAYEAVKIPFWQFKLETDFPTRSRINKFSLPWTINMVKTNPLELYLQLMLPARQFSISVGPNMEPWEAEEPESVIENFLAGADREIRGAIDSRQFPALPGDVIWFNRQGIWALWDGEHTQMPDDYGEDEAHLPDWISFPEYPLDHYRNLNPRQDLRKNIHLDPDLLLKPQAVNRKEGSFITVLVLPSRQNRAPRELADGLIIDEINRTIKVSNFFGEEFTIAIGDIGNSQRSVREILINSRRLGQVFWDRDRNRGELTVY